MDRQRQDRSRVGRRSASRSVLLTLPGATRMRAGGVKNVGWQAMSWSLALLARRVHPRLIRPSSAQVSQLVWSPFYKDKWSGHGESRRGLARMLEDAEEGLS